MNKQICLNCFHLKIVGRDGVVVGVKCAKEQFTEVQKYPVRYKGKGWVRRAETCVYYDDVEFR